MAEGISSERRKVRRCQIRTGVFEGGDGRRTELEMKDYEEEARRSDHGIPS